MNFCLMRRILFIYEQSIRFCCVEHGGAWQGRLKHVTLPFRRTQWIQSNQICASLNIAI